MRSNCNDHAQPVLTGYSDTYIKLAQHRIIVVSEDISDTMAAELSALLLYFDNNDHEAQIEIYLHSNGGAATGLVNIYDVMKMISAPIKTICLGKCYSAAAVLLAAGSKGERYAMKHSSIMIHGIQAGFPIPGHDITSSKNYFDYLKDNNDNIMKMLAHDTNHSLEKVKEDCKQDVWMNANTAKQYGIIDHIIE
ncbi:ClpP Protease subunit of ATP-dependent Clp proteases [uncultured Caudovirales phage]|uniref:ClpP Protease subunit of ATP-dependent Clp proteases n=1 Tax=uncultured Caudovirales phage TaxID=2100421 RepID=A0A6J5RRW5_9CAUD|nr:ClpP Protease subunit of ATP-dependent Clp proteases [uncultured Caudovirales phage]